jgi:putative CocE/NonD family hydrolase
MFKTARSTFLAACCSALILLFAAGVREARAEDAPTDFQLAMHVKIPMRDGVHLNATLYKPVLPAGQSLGPLPVIFLFSPYPADTSHPSGSYFARRGYIYAYVDVRGRGDSEGVFEPFATDARDGYDVVEWFAKQPWSNGKVAMFGGSYAGMDQWMTASQHPPHLVTIAPGASVRPAVDFPYEKGLMFAYALQWATFTNGRTLNSSVFEDGMLWGNAAKRLYRAKAPFSQLDKYAGSTDTVFQKWLAHPETDSFWKELQLSREQVAGVHLPVLVITGANDGDQKGTLSFYDDHITTTDAHTKENYFLVMGPWDHPGTRDPKLDFCGEHYGPASKLDVLRLHREWYDYTMKGGARPKFLEKPVAYYVAGPGAECWKYADSLAAVATGSASYYLNAAGGAQSVYHSGMLQPEQKGAEGGSFVNDPNDLSGADVEDSLAGALLHGDGLVFHTAPFEKEMEIDGTTDLRLWLSIDAPDTDLSYELDLIGTDGKARSLTFGFLRARYRHGLEHVEPIHENQPEEYEIKAEQWFAERAPKGSLLRLVVSGINSPQIEKSWNSMKPLAEQSGADARVAHVRLLQSAEHPSTLTIPLGDVAAACKATAEW